MSIVSLLWIVSNVLGPTQLEWHVVFTCILILEVIIDLHVKSPELAEKRTNVAIWIEYKNTPQWEQTDL